MQLTGQGFGAAGELRAVVGGAPAVVWPTSSWSDKSIAFTPPSMPVGTVAELKVAPATGGNVSNALKLRWLKPGAPEDCATAPPGAPCDDKDPATIGDACTKASTCKGIKPPCHDTGPCPTETFNQKLGVCEPSKLGPKPCDDGDPCTADDVCVSGTCKGDAAAALKACDDGKPCTTDTCEKASGCKHIDAGKGAPCDDGNACTQGDTCGAGGCALGKAVSCDDGNVCTTEDCEATKGCTFAPANGICNADDTDCTVGDTCQSGACKAGPAKVCSGSGPCATTTCNPSTGECSSTLNVGATCDDGELCTVADICSKDATCVGAPYDPQDPKTTNVCEDGKPCTIDTCEKGKGCVFVKDLSPACQ